MVAALLRCCVVASCRARACGCCVLDRPPVRMASKAREYAIAAAAAIASNNAARVAGHFAFSKGDGAGAPPLQVLARRELVRVRAAPERAATSGALSDPHLRATYGRM